MECIIIINFKTVYKCILCYVTQFFKMDAMTLKYRLRSIVMNIFDYTFCQVRSQKISFGSTTLFISSLSKIWLGNNKQVPRFLINLFLNIFWCSLTLSQIRRLPIFHYNIKYPKQFVYSHKIMLITS